MKLVKCTAIIGGRPVLDTPIDEAIQGLEVGGAIQILSPSDYISARQRAWWKGILLPALRKDTGESVSVWETRLKLAVMPDEFQPTAYVITGKPYLHVPSIKDLSVKKMNQLIEGSVDWLHGKGFDWVTLPDSELRK